MITASTTCRFSFSVKPGDEGTQAIKISMKEGELVTCSFKYATRRRSTNSDGDENNLSASNSDNNVRRPSIQSILGRLSGICIRKTLDYWKYELCFEGEVKQSHGQIQHNMGRYSGLEGPVQLYDEGTICETQKSGERKIGRKSRVEFQCDRQLRIRSVEEVTTCSYLVIVGTPIVCGSYEFAVAPSGDGSEGNFETSNQDELWIVELAQVGPGRVDCSAKTLSGEVRARPDRPALTTLEFSRFDFDLTVSSDSPTVLHHDLHVVRAPDRVRLSILEREYSLQSSSAFGDGKVGLKSGDAFLGMLEFIQLITRIEDSRGEAV